MQPNDQQGNWAPDTPQPVLPPAQPVPQAPPAGQYNVQQSPQYGQPTPQQAPVQPPPPQPALQPQPTTPQQAGALGSVAVADQVEDGYGFDTEDEVYDEGEIDLSEPISWQAKEYIHQEKGTLWFVIAGIILVVSIALAIFVMNAPTFAILLVVIAAVIVVLAKRPPRLIDYSLSNDGLHIDKTLHAYSDFKSFGVIQDGQEYSVMLIPRRRLMPGITVYFPEEAGEDIVDVLGSRLPMRDLRLDVVDRVVRLLRL